jgi:hypothetical protein
MNINQQLDVIKIITIFVIAKGIVATVCIKKKA